MKVPDRIFIYVHIRNVFIVISEESLSLYN